MISVHVACNLGIRHAGVFSKVILNTLPCHGIGFSLRGNCRWISCVCGGCLGISCINTLNSVSGQILHAYNFGYLRGRNSKIIHFFGILLISLGWISNKILVYLLILNGLGLRLESCSVRSSNSSFIRSSFIRSSFIRSSFICNGGLRYDDRWLCCAHRCCVVVDRCCYRVKYVCVALSVVVRLIHNRRGVWLSQCRSICCLRLRELVHCWRKRGLTSSYGSRCNTCWRVIRQARIDIFVGATETCGFFSRFCVSYGLAICGLCSFFFCSILGGCSSGFCLVKSGTAFGLAILCVVLICVCNFTLGNRCLNIRVGI